MQDSTPRLYASAIAIVSGAYSLVGAAGMEELGLGGVVMLVLGVVVLVHGTLLLTPAASRLRRVSGPAMILWAALMLGNQALLATMPAWGMGSAFGGTMGGAMDSAMSWDAGMTGMALLMLLSGLIMTFGGRADRTM